LSQQENFQETLLISSRFPGFPGVLDTLTSASTMISWTVLCNALQFI